MGGCNLGESSDPKSDELDRVINKLDEANKENKQLEKDYLDLEDKFQNANDRIKELEDELQNDSYNEVVENEVDKPEDASITEDTARKLVYEYIQENVEPADISSGYQYCVYKNNDVFIVEKFSPEPGTPDRSAVLLDHYQLDVITKEISQLAQIGPGQKQNCMNGTDI